METKPGVVHQPLNNKVCIAIVGGYLAVYPSEIIVCIAKGNQVEIHRNSEPKILKVPKTLEEVLQCFYEYDFMQANRSCIINTAHLVIFMKEDGGKVLMSDSRNVDVSDSYRNAILEWLGKRELGKA